MLSGVLHLHNTDEAETHYCTPIITYYQIIYNSVPSWFNHDRMSTININLNMINNCCRSNYFDMNKIDNY